MVTLKSPKFIGSSRAGSVDPHLLGFLEVSHRFQTLDPKKLKKT
jgi:hypothetical protein